MHSVITLTHNKIKVTRKCLDTLLDTVHPAWELIVVDNGSTDGTCSWLEGFREKAAARNIAVKLIFNSGNIGCSTARNQGAAAASGTLLTFIDNDIALRSRHWLTTLGRPIQNEPRVAMTGPKLVYPLPPYRIQCAGAGVAPTGRILFRGRGEDRQDPRFNRRLEVQCLISACCTVDHRAFDQAEGFDEAFNPVEFEDLDLCYRIRAGGKSVLYLPEVEMYHFESVTTAGTPSLPNTRLIVRNGLLFKKRWRHMFENENGPSDADARWKKLPPYDFNQIESLPLL